MSISQKRKVQKFHPFLYIQIRRRTAIISLSKSCFVCRGVNVSFYVFWISFTCAHYLLYQEEEWKFCATLIARRNQNLSERQFYIISRTTACARRYVNARVCVIYLQIYWYVIVLLKWINYCSLALTAEKIIYPRPDKANTCMRPCGGGGGRRHSITVSSIGK